SPKDQLPSISKKVWWYVSRPTCSRSLCFPLMRKHFWLSAARGNGGASWPRKIPLNCTMPALVKSRLGSLPGTGRPRGTIVCPRSWKNWRNPSRIWSPVTVAGCSTGSVSERQPGRCVERHRARLHELLTVAEHVADRVFGEPARQEQPPGP